MLIADNFGTALLFSIITMLSWGSNKIALKYITYPVALYTIDFFVFVFILHIIGGFTLGAGWFGSNKDDMWQNIVDNVTKLHVSLA